MAWFAKLCRNTGSMINLIVKPVGQSKQSRVVKKTVEEQTVSSTTTLRRTTIDEIEVRHGGDEAHRPDAKDK
jgi:hypothetical protein